MKIIEYLFERFILTLGFLFVVLPEIIMASLWNLKDWIGDVLK